MDLLNQFAYPSLSGYGKFTISLTMIRSPGEEITFTIGPAIPLTNLNNDLIPMSEVYGHIKQYIKKYAEIYEGDVVVRIMIRVYMEGKKMDRPALSEEARYSLLSSIAEQEFLVKEPVTRGRLRSPPRHITALKASSTKLKAFMVGDIETLLIDDVHKPYAAGLLMVRPGEEIKDIMVESYFSEDYSLILDSFEERSTKVLYDLVLRIATIAREEKKTLTIYFHNFSRFDGIILLRHLACHHQNYKVKALLC